MKTTKMLTLAAGTLFFLNSCLSSMTPVKVNGILTEYSESKLLLDKDAEEAVKSDGCKYLVQNRSYTAPIGLTGKDDLKNAAKGIDDWVKLDGGNSYVLKGYQWVNLSWNGANQLQVNFDTLSCE